jgi:hypothetical protein
MPRKPFGKFIDEFIKQPSSGEIKLIAGIDPDPPAPYPNAIFYIRMVSPDVNTKEVCKTEKIWLTLSEMTRLSVLMTIASRFWVERLNKGEGYTEERIKEFQDEYKEIKEAMERLLPK